MMIRYYDYRGYGRGRMQAGCGEGTFLLKNCLISHIKANFFQNSDHAQTALYFPNYDVVVKSIQIKEDH